MKYIIRTLCCVFLIIITQSLHAQPYYFKQYQVEQGLSNNNITCCIQDTHGFLWFGTRDGLNRFDGYTFHVFRNNPEQSKSLGNNSVKSLTIDQNGVLWAGTDKGLFKYNQQEENFDQIPFTNNMRVSELHFNEKNDLWLLLDGKLIKYNEQLEFHKTYSTPDNSTLSSFCLTPQGNIWVSTSNGILYQLDEEQGVFSSFNLFTHSENTNSKAITKVYSSTTTNKLFIGTMTHGVKIFDTQSGEYRDLFRYEDNQTEITVRDFIQKSPDEVWIGTESGLFIYQFSTDQYIQIKKTSNDPYSLSANSIYAFCQDKENGIWIGTLFGGINYYSPFQVFTKYYSRPYENSLVGDVIHDICEDQYGNLWIATEDAGINCLESQTGKYTNYQPTPHANSIIHNNIHGMIADGNKLWIGTYAHGIDVMDIPTRKIIKHYAVGEGPNYLRSNIIVNMRKTKNGQILVATSRGLFTYDNTSDQFVFMPQFPSQFRVQSVFEDRSGTIWAGTILGGAHYYNPNDQTKGAIAIDTISSYNSNTINDIYEDQNSCLWFATMKGVIKYDKTKKSTQLYSTKEGMPSNVTFRILADQSNNLWISTTNGLVMLNPQTNKITTYTKANGLITKQFNYNSALKDSKGQMYFGLVKGMISFDPENITPDKNKPQVYLTDLSYFDEPTQKYQIDHSVAFLENTVLKHNQSTFNINFSTLGYIAPEITEFAYCMEGLDKTWVYLQGNHTAYFTKLSPGQYTFKVKAANVSGVWTEEPTLLHITILPPWWLSPVAWFVYVLIAFVTCALVIWSVIRHNKEAIRRQMQTFESDKEKELYRSKINFFINIAHEIRTPLTLIKSPLDKVISHTELPPDAKSYLDIVNKNANRLLALVNQLLDFRKTEIKEYSLNFIKTDIVSLLYETAERFRDTAEQESLQLSIETEIPSYPVFIDNEACTKILSNLLSNAVKYARSHIIIKFAILNEDRFAIDMVNDGEKISEETKEKIFEPFFRGESSAHKSGTGLGLPLARSLAEMHRGTLELTDAHQPFITFRLCLPVNQPHSIKFADDEKVTPPTTYIPTYTTEQSRPTILVVEDNKEMQYFIGQEVNSIYNVVVADNGQEALAVLEEYGIQLIISDIMMPLMDGFTLLKKVKTNLEFSHIPVILLTARNTVQSRLEGLELGADAYMDKPFSMDLLLAQIVNLLNNRNSIRSYYFNSPIVHMKSMAYTKADENFLDKLNDIINLHINNVELDVDMIAGQMNLSRPTLYRKINALSNLTPNDLIKLTRLKKAAELILQGNMKIYEISEAVGFNSQSYFSRAFSKQFNMSPSQYAKVNNVELG